MPACRFCLHAFGFGGKGIRTPDFQLAKLALYQLSYAPALRIEDCRWRIADCNSGGSAAPRAMVVICGYAAFLTSSGGALDPPKENAGPEEIFGAGI